MAKRTPEEILAQRDAWMARKAAREAGEDVPLMPPLKPGEEPPESAMPEAEPEQPAAEAEAEPEPEEDAAEAESAQPAADEAPATSLKPESPKRKRTPEEIRAQREAFMAARAAKAAGTEAPEAKAEAPAQAPKSAAAPAKPAEKPAASKPAPKPKPKPKPRPKAPAPDEPLGPINRREFLNYAWLASIALFTVETIGLSLWFAFPNFREGDFGGIFPIGQAGEVLPEVNAAPKPFTEGKFWLVNVDQEVDGEPRQGVLALFKICTHLGCLYDWVDTTFRFECPCHGSKFQLTGDYIAGPARRSLDRFVIRRYAPEDDRFQNPLAETNENGEPLVVNEGDVLVVDTGAKILGSSDIEIA